MNKKQRGTLALLAATLGLAPASNALADGFYFGLSGGLSMPDLPSKAEFDQVILAGTPAQSSLDDTGTAWGAQVGYRWGSYIAAEIGYVDLGKAEYEAVPTGTPLRASVRFASSGVTLAAVGMLPLGERFDLYARGGVYFGDTRLRQKIEDLSTGESLAMVEDTSSSKDLFAGIGAAWNITESFSLRLQYERYFGVGEDDETGKTDIDLLTFGVLFR